MLDDEKVIEKISRTEKKKIGKGYRRSLLVEWKGFSEPTWELRTNMEDTVALDVFEAKCAAHDGVGEDFDTSIGRRKSGKHASLAQSKKGRRGDYVTSRHLIIGIQSNPNPS